MSPLWLALCLAASAAAVSLPKVETPSGIVRRAVFKGAPATAAERRHLVSITFSDDREPFTCSGVLVAPNVAATAAHCWDGGFTPRSVALHGAGDAARPALAGARHEGYDEDADPDHASDDIGFVVFGGKTPDGAAPVEVLADPPGARVGDVLAVVGTGNVEPGAERGPRRAQMRVVRVDGRTLTADGGRDIGACLGDSGGPAYLRRDGALVAAALVSSGPATRCRTGGPAELVYLPPYRAWLLSAARAAQERLSAPR